MSKYLSYTMIATLDTYVIILVVQASLSSYYVNRDSFWANESGLGFDQSSLFEQKPPYIVMTFDQFIKWATERETELLEFILKQF